MLTACSAKTADGSLSNKNSSTYVLPWLRSDFELPQSSKKPSSSAETQSKASSASGNISSSSNVPASSKNSSKTSSSASQIPTVNTDGLEKYSGTRDPWLWPFSATSIWNMPIGSEAKLQKANFKDAYGIAIDDEDLFKVP